MGIYSSRHRLFNELSINGKNMDDEEDENKPSNNNQPDEGGEGDTSPQEDNNQNTDDQNDLSDIDPASDEDNTEDYTSSMPSDDEEPTEDSGEDGTVNSQPTDGQNEDNPEDNEEGTEDYTDSAPSDDEEATDDSIENDLDMLQGDDSEDYTSSMPSDDEEPTEDSGEDGTPDENTDDVDSEDYTDSVPSDDEDNTSEDGDKNIDNNLDDASTEDSDIKDLEKEIFADLSPVQITIRQTELLDNFMNLYKSLKNIEEDIKAVAKSSENAIKIDFVIKSIIQLKVTVNDIITTSFATRSYIENAQAYQQCLVTLSYINKLIEEIGRTNE